MALKYKGLCYKCRHFKQIETSEYWSTTEHGYRKLYPAEYHYRCDFLDRYIQKIRQKCKNYLNIYIRPIIMGVNGNMKIDKVPNEGERIDLKDLPQDATLKAVSERFKEESPNSPAGLVITFKMLDERTFAQKYSALSGAVLVRAMKDLKLKDTEDLAKDWFHYKLTPMRMGKPRMIPISKVKA